MTGCTITGSTQVGKSISAVCAERMARCTLELGGKSAALVLDDFGIELAGRTLARSIVAQSGQVRAMTSRVIVSQSRHDDLVVAIAAETAKVRVGHSDDPATEMGPIALGRQLARVNGFIEEARTSGTVLVSGGKRPAGLETGFFVEPTHFAGVDPADAIAQEEIFGSVLSVIPCRNRDDAIRIANNSRFGLSGSIYTDDDEAAYDIACRIRTGLIAQNGFKADLDLPFGGFR